MTIRTNQNGKLMIDIDLMLPDGSRRRIRKVSPYQAKRAAEQYERELRANLLNGTIQKEEAKQEIPTLAEFSKEFMETYVATNNAPSEQEGKRYDLDKHLLPRFGRKQLNEIGLRDIEKLKADLIKTHKPATINNILTVLRKILNHALDMEVIEKIPRFKLLRIPPQPFEYLGFDEYGQLIKAVSSDSELSVAMLLAGDAGLRRGEINALRWQDINFPLGKLTVWESIWRGQRKEPKGKKARTVPLTKRLTHALKAHRHLGEYVLMRDSKPWTVETFRWQGARAYRLAQLPPVVHPWHCLRHTFCSHLAMKGASPRAIMELAGHSELSTTLRYMHLAPATLTQAISLLESENYGITTALAV